MDNDFLVKSLHGIVKADRDARMGQSEQLTLGELILKLEQIEPIYVDYEKKTQDKTVHLNFEYAFPTGVSSWRGSYDELALTFDFAGYSQFGNPKEKPKPMTLTAFLKLLKETIGKEFTGWKGGEFIMGKTTPVWIANDGNSGNTGVVDVTSDDYSVTLIGGYCEY
jgi:hypothetical protein